MAVQERELTEKPKTLRVRVVDKSKDGAPVVNIKMPVRVVKFGLKMAKAFAPQMKDVDLDCDGIEAMIEDGAQGKIVDVDDEIEHKSVEVWLD